MLYNKYSYIFPPRPKNSIPPKDLDSWDNGTMLGQLKLNGSNSTFYLNSSNIYVSNRHNQILTNFKLEKSEIIDTLYQSVGLKDKFLVINGEYLNKSKMDENNVVFNHKLVIFDILVYNSDHLIGKTFEQRINLMDEVYGQNECEKPYLYQLSENIYRVKTFDCGFKNMFDTYTPIDMIEGVVLKRKNARLEMGLTENNNFKSQVKSRKETKNYKF